MLKQQGAKDAMREMYAVLKTTPSGELAASEAWGGAHHEIDDKGTVKLNKSALVATVAQLAKPG